MGVFLGRLRARCGRRFQKAETTPAKAARGAFFRKRREKRLLEKGALQSKAKPWEMNLPYMVRPALQGKIFTESTREKLHPYIRPMI
ncbi:MAG: hypothetical protein H7834_13680, partial [Magnetococcus sp. YQC-9]